MTDNRAITSPGHSRRLLLKAAAASTVAMTLPGTLLTSAAQAQTSAAPSDVIMRRFPRGGVSVPAVGLGTFMTFDIVPGKPRKHIEEVVRRFWLAGGRVFDVSPLYGTAEVNLGDAASLLGINEEMIIANKLWTTGDYLADTSHSERSLRTSLERLWRERLDVIQCHSLVNVDIAVPLMNAWKKEGRVRFVGATHHEPAYFDLLAGWIERGNLDFVQVHYSIHTRQAEERVLAVAADRGTGVLANMPLEKGRLHKLVNGRPLPAFAKELQIESWSQFFLKWVISHPTVTCAIPATSNPDHVMDNMGALRGPLPDRAMRARMVQYMQSIPGFDQLDQDGARSWYPGKAYPGLVGRAQADLRSRT